MKSVRLVLLSLAIPALTGSPLVAQSFERATLQGTVVDASGGVLPGVTVSVRNVRTNLERSLMTLESGQFQAPGLAPGEYEVTAALDGFKTAVQSNVHLLVGQTVTLTLTLEVGSLEERVTVMGGAPLIETAKTDVSSVISSEQIDNLPINGRNFLDFATLTPGVVFNQSTAINGIGANVAGARSRNGSVLVDGFNNLDDNFTSPRLIYSQEAIREFQVLTLGFAPEFGRATGGIVNAVTKSGTNEFEGRAFYFGRDKSLNARNAFEQGEKAGFRRHQWGGTAGGPIRRDKVFFFSSFERQDFNAPVVVTITPAIASQIGLPSDQLGTHQKQDDYTSALAKVNYNHSGASFFEFTVAHSRFERANLTTVGGLVAPSAGTGTQSRDYLFGFKWSLVFGGGRWLNELRASYNPRDFFVLPQGDGPRTAISGVATFGRATNSPNAQYTEQGQIINHISASFGRHSLKMGIDAYPVKSEIYFPGGEFGSYSFASLAAFTAGNYNSYSQTFGENLFPLVHHFYAGFVQDSWRLSQNLTATYGLRYEFEKQPTYQGRQYPSDSNNFGPRGGLAWDVTGAGRYVLRAHTGLFYDKNFNNIALNTFRGDGVTSRSYSFQNRTQPGAPQYPNILTQEPGSGLGIVSVRLMVEDPSIPQAWQSSVAFEFAIDDNTSAAISYMRNDQSRQYVNITRNRFTTIDGVRQRPDPTVGAISVYEPSGVSKYNAVSFQVNRRTLRGVQLNASYTYGVANADSNDFGSGYIDENNRHWDYGPAPDDVRHNLVVSGVYMVPRTDIGLSGIWRFNSGRPYSASAGADLNNDGVINDRAPGFTENPGPFRGDSFKRLDLRLSWRPRVAARTVEFIGEVFNALNTINYDSINTVWGPTSEPRPTFGQPLTAGDPRVVQLGARLTF